jgi:uncharacterized protein (TIGR02391 family)
LSTSDRTAELSISSERQTPDNTPETAAEIEIKSLEFDDLRRIESKIREWQTENTTTARQTETGPLAGTCVHDGGVEEIDRLRVTIDQQGIGFVSISDGIDSTRAQVPASPECTDGEYRTQEYIHLLAVLINIAIASIDPQGPTELLDVQGEFSGPIDEYLDEAVDLYRQGNHFSAVRTACQDLEDQVRSRAQQPENLRGNDLMFQTFSPGSPVLQVSDEEGEQQGVMHLYQGAMLALRNPTAHRTPDPTESRYLDQFSQRHARNIIYYLDFLSQLLDHAELTD